MSFVLSLCDLLGSEVGHGSLGIGTVVGMMLITTAIALPFTYTLRHFARLNQVLAITSGTISVSFGLFLCYQIGISEGLFTGHPTWVPR